jgi:hypothetical protein
MDDFNRVTKLEVTSWRMTMVICLQIPRTFWIGGRTTSLSYWMSIVAVMLVRNKYSWVVSAWS